MGRDWDQFGRRAFRSPALGRCAAAILWAGFAGAVSPTWAGEAPFGALVLRWDADVWSMAEREDGFQASCLVSACKGRVVTGAVAAGEACSPPVTERHQDLRETTLESGPLRWRVAKWWLGCRNAHPQSVAACTVHEGRVYRVSAPLVSCRTSPGHGADAQILSLVRGIRP